MSPTLSTPATAPPAHSSRSTLLLLAVLFVLPFVLGSSLFWTGWHSEKTSQHGQLLQPVVPLPSSGLQLLDGRSLATSELLGKWLLVLPVNASCDELCQHNLQQMFQIHTALNKEQTRLQRVLIASGVNKSGVADLLVLRQRFPDLVIAMTSESATETTWKSIFPGHEDELYIADPFGNLMMRYADPAGTRGVLKDLERLLKYSWVR